MQALHRLAASSFQIWPFDAPGLPLVVEIFPRLLTGAVTKNRQHDRERYLAALAMPPEFRRLAAASEDAFDAAVRASHGRLGRRACRLAPRARLCARGQDPEAARTGRPSQSRARAPLRAES
jgi:hypothetical protein